MKTLAISLLSPLSLCVLILSVGVLLLWSSPNRKIGRILVSLGVCLLWLFGLPFFPNLILADLEYRYAPYFSGTDEIEKDLKYIVVLAGGYRDAPGVPVASRFSHPGLLRVVAGIQLYRRCSEAKLVLSGGTGGGSTPESELMSELCIDLGVPVADIILESSSNSTYEEALNIERIVKHSEFYLVTSASHMPRSMALFSNLGINPFPAPAGYQVKDTGDFSFFPSPYNFVKSYTFFYERVGLVKEWLLGRI